MTTDINGLRKAITKQLDLRLDQYVGLAREGDLIIDTNPGPTLNQVFVGTANGGLVPVGGGGNSSYSNANVANYLPVYTGNIGANAINATSITVADDILPAANITSNLGSPTQRWNSIYLSNNTIYLGDAALSIDGVGNLTVDGEPVAYVSNAGNMSISGDITANNIGTISAINLDGNVANVLAGDGTWIAAGGGGGNASLPLANGTSNFDIATVNGPATITVNGTETWTFRDNGNLVLPQGGVITEGGGLAGAAITLTPVGGSSTQSLLIYPTVVGDGDHVHLTAGGGNTELYLGDDFHYVKLADSGNVEVRADDGVGSVAAWQFDPAGGLTFPDGTTQTTAYIDPNEPPYRGFYAGLNRFYGADPSVNQIIITNATSIPTYTNLSNNTNDDAFQATGLDTASIVVMLNLYGASSSLGIDPTLLKTVAELFIDNVLYDGATAVTDAAAAKTRFYAAWSTVFAPVSGELFTNFRFWTPTTFDSVAATGGTGTDFIPVLINGVTTYSPDGWNNAGTGYTVGDVLTVTGDQYSGTTPTNDATFTVTAIGPSGEVQDYTVSGQPVNNWPTNSIQDGGSDQYDTGNYIQTNVSGGYIPYNNGDVETSGSYWGGSSEYATVYQTSTWAMMAFNTGVSSARYAGSMGADGSGTKQSENLIGGSGDISLGNFVFLDDEMTATGDDMYIKANDDLYLDALADDIHIRANDDARVYVNYNFTSGSFDGQWVFRSGSPAYMEWPDGTQQNTAWTGSVTVGNVSGIGNIATANFDGNVANVLAGDGTWIAAGGGASLPLANGTSNINIAAADGNVAITANATNTWTFDETGNLVLPGSPGRYIRSPAGGYAGLAAVDDGTDLPAQLVSINAASGQGTTAISAYANNALIQANITGDMKSWVFTNDGRLQLPQGSEITETASIFGASAINLAPAGGSATQRLLIYPTAAADGDHVHLTSGDMTTSELYLGDDNQFVKVGNTGNIVVSSYNGATSQVQQWNFGNDGMITLPSGLTSIGNLMGADVILANNTPFGILANGFSALSVLQWIDDITNPQALSAVQINPPTGTPGDVVIISGPVLSQNTWNFGANVIVTFPQGSEITDNIGYLTVSTAVYAATTVSQADTITTATLDLQTSDLFVRTITGATTFSLTNVPAAGRVARFILQLTNPGTNVTWWSGIKWNNGTPPLLTASGTDVLSFYSYDGTSWVGLVLAQNIS